MTRPILHHALLLAAAVVTSLVASSAPLAAQDRPATAGRTVILNADDASTEVGFLIRPYPDSTDGSQLLSLASLSKEGCRYSIDQFEVPVQTNRSGFGLKRVLRVIQEKDPDGSCTEVLAMRVFRDELEDLAAADSVVLHLPTGPIALTEEARRSIASVAPTVTSTRKTREPREFAKAIQTLNLMLTRDVKSALEFSEAIAPAFRARPSAESVPFFAALGMARRLNGDLDGAALSDEVALMIADVSGEASAGVGVVYDNLATVRLLQKRWDAATAASDRALAIFERTVGVRHSSYGTALNNRALLLLEQGDVVRALDYSERAIDVLRDALKDPGALNSVLENNRIIREKLRLK